MNRHTSTPAIDKVVFLRRLSEEAAAFRRVEESPLVGSSAAPGSAALFSRVLPPDFLEGYAFVREIHRGGQGVVYEGMQNATRRRVAIKLFPGIKPNTRAARRFEREAELITQLRHPNVVTVLDAGERGGVFFIIMEHVDGVPIDQYVASRLLGSADVPSASASADVPSAIGSADILSANLKVVSGVPSTERVRSLSPRSEKKRRKAALTDLLQLFAKVCDGVAAAHLKGIIHRDLKPANILVDAEGQPRVLDFGLAKLESDNSESSGRASEFDDRGAGFQPAGVERVSQPVAEGLAGTGVLSSSLANEITQTGQFVGSVQWASPEQAAGDNANIDIRTDVYSLGVVLYQLLSGGRFPYDVTGRSRDVLNRIMTDEPAKLCIASPSVPSWLRAFVPASVDSDVEAIVLKCLTKHREGRYSNAGDLAAEIRRFLSGDAIEVKRDLWWYVARKFLRRHWKPTFVVTVGTLAILFAWQQQVQQTRESRIAFELMDRLAVLSEYVGKSVADENRIRTKVLQCASELDNLDLRDSAVACRVRLRLAQLFSNIGDPVAVENQAVDALDAARRIQPREDELLEASLQRLASSLTASDPRRALGVALELVDVSRRVHGAADENALNALASVYRVLKDGPNHESQMRELIRQYPGAAYERGLAEFLCDDQCRYDEAYLLQQRSLEFIRSSGGSPIAVAHCLHSFGHLLIKMERWEEAETVLRECVAIRSEAYGADEVNAYYIAVSKGQLGSVLSRLGKFEEAAPLLRYAHGVFAGPIARKWVAGNSTFHRESVQRLAQLYEWWNEAEPERGYAEQAAEWRTKLSELPVVP